MMIAYPELDPWLIFLSEKGIEELVIRDFDSTQPLKLPPCVFQFFGCNFKLPRSFKGFTYLTSLELSESHIDDYVLENLALNCPVLSRMCLHNIRGFIQVKIKSASLTYLSIDSKFEDIFLQNMPRLSTVVILGRYGCRAQIRDVVKGCNFFEVLGSLHSVRNLTLSGPSLESLSMTVVPTHPLHTHNNLLSLYLKEISLHSADQVSVSILLLRSSPNLQELEISVQNSRKAPRQAADILEEQSMVTNEFNRLQSVTLRGVTVTKFEWEFIQFILDHSPVLDTMTILNYGSKKEYHLQMLPNLKRASENAKIFYWTC